MQEIWETWVQSLGLEDPLEKDMATHSSIFVWKIPRTEEPGGLQSIGSKNQKDNNETTTLFCRSWWLAAGFLRAYLDYVFLVNFM